METMAKLKKYIFMVHLFNGFRMSNLLSIINISSYMKDVTNVIPLLRTHQKGLTATTII